MRSFNDVVNSILNENDGRSLPAIPAPRPSEGADTDDGRGFVAADYPIPVPPPGVPSLGDMIYNLIESLDEDAKTNTGARVKDVLEDILLELEDITASLSRVRSRGQLESFSRSLIDSLIRRLSLD